MSSNPYWYEEKELTEEHKRFVLRYVAVVGDVEDFLKKHPEFKLKDGDISESN